MQVLPYEALKIWFSRVGYEPSPEQEQVHRAALQSHENPGGPLPTVVVVAGGEQGGKSMSMALHAFGRWMVDRLVWLVGDRYEDTKREYEYIRDAGIAAGVLKRFSTAQQGPWELEFINGLTVKAIASEDVTALAREAPDGILMCEPGRQTFDSFEYCFRRVVPKTGWMIVAGTFENSVRWFPDLVKEAESDNPWGAQVIRLPSYGNRTLYPLGERDPKFKAAVKAILDSHPTDGMEIIGERFLGIPRTPQDLVFSEFRRSVHVKEYAEFVPHQEVHLAVDPGYSPSAYAIAFIQRTDDEIRVFDELYLHQMVTDEVVTLVRNHHAFPYVTHVVLDVAAGAHAGAQTSAYETWLGRLADTNITISGQRVMEAEGRSRLHDKLRVNPMTGRPYLVFHPRVRWGSWEFEDGYRKRRRRDGSIGSDEPIDRNNHIVKALAYYIVDRYGLSDIKLPSLAPTRRPMAYDLVFGRRR